MDVVVLGSLNMDLVARVDRLPLPGETITGHGSVMVPGGKGANQAVAAARLGASTAMVGRVGDDDFGKVLRSRLMNEKIDLRGVSTSSKQPSGTAWITVAPYDNQIVVVPGANGEVDEEDLAQLMPYFPQASVLLVQFEIPLMIVEKAAALAHQAGLTVIVDPAPASPLNQKPLAADFCEYISILTPNQTEAAALTGQPVKDAKGAIAAAETLQRQGIEVVIVKLGKQGSVCASAAGTFAVPAFPVEVVDTVAAGDAFNGGLAAALTRVNRDKGVNGWNLSDHDILRPAINYASAVAALAVTRAGAQASMPTAAAVKDFLQIQPFEVGPI
ncbi:MAG: ribokinase [Cyanobacteria bacterium P01_F01_bin.53]